MSWLRSEGAFRSGGDTCAAWVYRPAVSPAAQAPVIVMAHGFGCVRALRLPAYAERFASAGLRGGGLRLPLLRGQRWVAPSTPRCRRPTRRLACRHRLGSHPGRRGTRTSRRWGTSLSGGHVITWPAPAHRSPRSWPRYRISVGSPPSVPPASARPHVCCPPPRGHRAGLVPPPAALRGFGGSAGIARDHGDPDAWPGVAKDGCGRRVGSSPTSHSPSRPAPPFGSGRTHRCATPVRVMCPALIQVTADDALCPTSATRKALSRMADARLESYPGRISMSTSSRCSTPWSQIRSRFCGWWRPSRGRPSVEHLEDKVSPGTTSHRGRDYRAGTSM